MPRKKPEQKKRGRPPSQKYFSADELKENSKKLIRNTAEHRLDFDELDVEDFIKDMGKVTRIHKFSEAEFLRMRQKLDLLYQTYITDNQIEEAKQNELHIGGRLEEALADPNATPKTGFMSQEQWYREHGLRKDGQKKRGPKPRPKKTIYDIPAGERGTALEKVESADLDAIEQEWLENYIEEQKNAPQPVKGKRFRDTEALKKRNTPPVNIWY